MHKFKVCFFSALIIITAVIVIALINYVPKKDSEVTKVENSLDRSQIQNYIGDVYSSNISKDLIYATAYMETESDIDLSNVSEIYEKADLVITGGVTDNLGGHMIEELEYAGILGSMQIDNIIKGNFNNEKIEFFTNGGYCTIQEYIDVISKNNTEKISRMGLDNLSVEEKQSKYLVFNNKYGKNFELGKRYVLMLKKINDKYICMSKFGFLEIGNDSTIENLSDILSIVQ